MTKPCRCEAYRFPHRRYSGKCYAAEIESEAEIANRPYSRDSWGRPYDKFLCGEWDDTKHNDPRTGQAKHINAGR